MVIWFWFSSIYWEWDSVSRGALKAPALHENPLFFLMPHTPHHRYLIPRLSLKVVYLWRHVSSTAPPFILWWWNLETLFAPLNCSSPFIGELRCQAIQMVHALIQYSRWNPKRSLYCEMSVLRTNIFFFVPQTNKKLKRFPSE
jgi:hypothetical protein